MSCHRADLCRLRRVLAGERDADALCEGLDLEDSMIVETILAALEDPSTLDDLLRTDSSGAGSKPRLQRSAAHQLERPS